MKPINKITSQLMRKRKKRGGTKGSTSPVGIHNIKNGDSNNVIYIVKHSAIFYLLLVS